MSGVPNLECDSTGQRQSEWHQSESDVIGMTAPGYEAKDDPSDGQKDCEDQQETARSGCRQIRHQLSLSGPGLVQASGSSVTWPVSEYRRQISETATALAAKGTTIPVMTIACGIGSWGKSAAAPRRAIIPKTRKTPLPIRLKASNLRSGWGCTTRP